MLIENMMLPPHTHRALRLEDNLQFFNEKEKAEPATNIYLFTQTFVLAHGVPLRAASVDLRGGNQLGQM